MYSPSLSPSGRYVSYLASSPSSGASTEGVIQVRDLCYGAGKSCAARAYAVDDLEQLLNRVPDRNVPASAVEFNRRYG